MGCGISNNRQQGYQRLTQNGQVQAGRATSDDKNGSLADSASSVRLHSRTREIIQGNLTLPCPATSKIVRIFTSSTFTDTHHERNALMEHAYPLLRSICQEHGYEFQVVDMRWGVRDEATDDHMATTLCLREVDNCHQLSTGPYFVTFLSHKYGYMDIPREIPSGEFELLLSADLAEEARSLLQKWYRRDDNAVPATHILQPISLHLPEFLSPDKEVKRRARESWGRESALMQKALAVAARQKLEREAADKYDVSVTEAELRTGVLNRKADPSRCLWFHRIIPDLEQHPPSYTLSRYTECYGEDLEGRRERMRRLRDEQLAAALPGSCRLTYTVHWTDQGIDPASQPEHQAYIQQLCEDFKSAISAHILRAVKESEGQQSYLPVVEEVIEHTRFCQSKCHLFHGRQEILQRIWDYVESDGTVPLVIHGASGYGKTSILAVAASRTWHLLSGRATVVLRFLGTTPSSCSLLPLLSSLVLQIRLATGQSSLDLPLDLRDMIQCFKQTLAAVTSEKPLVLFLDSLDQLEPAGGARQLSWLPTTLPSQVKVVLSTLPDEQYESFPRLQALYPGGSNMVEVGELSGGEVATLLDQWLDAGHRQLTPGQRQLVEQAFLARATPLFLKLAFHLACKWHSYSPPEVTVLAGSVRESISALLSRLERMHGAPLVSRALGFLTLSRRGLSEAELEDLLSCSEEVLDDIYAYWTPPVRRLPPLLLVRLRADLEGYLVDRGTDGVRVFYWYHRQFIQAARERYCSDPGQRGALHAAMADYFSGVWAEGREKPFSDKSGKPGAADRHVAAQPLKFGNSYNLRKLNNLPWHRLHAGQLDLLKKECLLNYDFLFAKLQGSGLRSLLEDAVAARDAWPGDAELGGLCQALQLSQDSLLYNAGELPGQLQARLLHCPPLRHFLLQCSSRSTFLQVTPPVLSPAGGPLLHSLAGDPYRVRGLDLSQDGNTLVTWPSHLVEGIKVWDVESGRLRQTVEVGEKVHEVQLCCQDAMLLVELYSGDALLAFRLDTGSLVYKIGGELAACRKKCVLGGQEEAVVTVADGSLRYFRAATGDLEWEAPHPDGYTCNSATILAAGGNIIAVAHKCDVITFDLSARKALTLASVLEEVSQGVKEGVAAMCLSPDGSTLLLTGRVDSDIHLLDPLSLARRKTLPGRKNEIPGPFHVTPSGSHLYYAAQDCLVAWDLQAEARATFLKGDSKFSDVRTVDMRTAVSIGLGNTIKIWNLDLAEKTEGVPKKEEEEEFAFRKLRFLGKLPNPRYVLLQEDASSKLGDKSACFLSVYDLCQHKVIRKADIGRAVLSKLLVLDDETVVYVRDSRVALLDLRSFRETLRFHGRVSHTVDMALNMAARELLASSADRKSVVVFSLKTGDVAHTFPLPKASNGDVEKVLTDEAGKVLAVAEGDRKIHLHDLQARRFLYTLDRLSVGEHFAYRPLVTADGQLLVTLCFDSQSAAPTEQERKMEEKYGRKTFPVVWNIKKACLQSQLRKFEIYRTHLYRLLDSSTLPAISVSDTDHRIRLFDLLTGEVLRESAPAMGLYHKLEVGAASPFIITYSEKRVWLWDRLTLQCLASLSLEKDTLREVHLSADGQHVLGLQNEDTRLVVFSLRGGGRQGEGEGGQSTPFSQYPELPSSPTVYQLQPAPEDEDTSNSQGTDTP